ncbi:MAG: Gfo/Idh/MocA family oxidoreductase [Bacteroidota bacterium]|nr:Gfo/Idh/MocA family oxidoreductase [Bacteroidota bacterium]
MLTIGVLGAGNAGKTHIRLLKEIDAYELVGFYEPSKKIADAVSEEFGLIAFPSAEMLLEACDVIDITSPTSANYKIAEKALRKSRHVFIEKPFSNSVAETKSLMRLAVEANSKVQVGQVERFNAAFIASKRHIGEPLFIETQRLHPVHTLEPSISLVMDLLIHDIDIVLSLVKANIRHISATGVAVINESPDIVNARIEFDNGAVANLMVSRVALENKHSSMFFRRDAYINVDFLENKAHIVHPDIKNEASDEPSLLVESNSFKTLNNMILSKIEVAASDAVKMQLESFAAAIINNTRPLVPIDDGYNAMAVANKIIDQLSLNATFAAAHTIIA